MAAGILGRKVRMDKKEAYEMPLKWKDSDKEIRVKCEDAAHKIYGDILPEEVELRLSEEIDDICRNGYETLYLTVSSLIQGMGFRKSEYNYRGCSGNSFVAYLLGISGAVNPLPSHYRCSEAHYSEFQDCDTAYGYELPDKTCPVCGRKLIKDGFSLSEKFFMGEDGRKKPDFSINVVSGKKEEAMRVLGYMKGLGQIVGCGSADAETNTERFVLRHPSSVILIPDYAGDAENYLKVIRGFNGEMISETDYYEVDHIFSKIGILWNTQTDHLSRVEDLTGITADSISLDDNEVVAAFKPSLLDELHGVSGIDGLTGEIQETMLRMCPIRKFSDLVKLFGLMHGTGTWTGNAEELLMKGIVSINEVITDWDDVYDILIKYGIDKELAFSYAERIRKGRGITEEQKTDLCAKGIPEWFIESCGKIRYLFPRAHSISYVLQIWQLAWYKLHYPVQFYRAYLETAFISDTAKEIMLEGEDAIREELESRKALEEQGYGEYIERDEDNALKVALEMYMKGMRMPGLWQIKD